MVIEKTGLAAGMMLTGRYKGQEYHVLVLGESEPFSFELALAHSPEGRDGATVYKSLSSAAKAAMGGGSASVNGWRFFSVAGSGPVREAPERKGKAKATGSRTVAQIKKRRKQEGCAADEVAWWCSACMESFCLPAGETPDVCPKGHPREVVDDFAGTPATSD